MNRLKIGVFEESVNFVLQTNAAKLTLLPKTLAAKKLADKASAVEAKYDRFQMKPEELLRLVAVHYDDKNLVAMGAPNPEASQNGSQDPNASVDPNPLGEGTSSQANASQSLCKLLHSRFINCITLSP